MKRVNPEFMNDFVQKIVEFCVLERGSISDISRKHNQKFVPECFVLLLCHIYEKKQPPEHYSKGCFSLSIQSLSVSSTEKLLIYL